MKRHLLSIFLALLGFHFSVAQTVEIDGIKYTEITEDIPSLNSGFVVSDVTVGYYVSGFTPSVLYEAGDAPQITIPDVICVDGVYYPVLHIANNAFNGLNAKSLVLPRRVYRIETGAFGNAHIEQNLMINTTLPSFTAVLQANAFTGMSGGGLQLGNTFVPQSNSAVMNFTGLNVGMLDLLTFRSEGRSLNISNCENLTTLILPQDIGSMTETRNHITALPSLKSITIPGSVDSINAQFEGCPSLQKVIFEESPGGKPLQVNDCIDGAESLHNIGFSASHIDTLVVNRKIVGNTSTMPLDCLNYLEVNATDIRDWEFSKASHLETINVMTTTPPAVMPFEDEQYNTVQLLIPDGEDVYNAYIQHLVWKHFLHISGINTVERCDADIVSVKYYDLQGHDSSCPFKGMNIVLKQYRDGSKQTTKQIF